MYPWCLKYRVRLLAIESPLADESGREPTPLDLLTAVKICAEEPIGELTNASGNRIRRTATPLATLGFLGRW